MTTDEKFNIILSKLTNLEEGQDLLFKGQKSLEEGQDLLKEEFLDLKYETELSFENTNKLINQAFKKINENISYQDKVTEIEKIIHSRQKSFA